MPDVTTLEEKRIRIPFHIHPYKFEQGLHAVEKADTSNGGVKRRYLVGITSGMKIDGHGERMTKACIDYMQEQAKSGSILLYEGQHGVTFTEDIGKLVDSEVTPTGEWITTYRLYDALDGFPEGSDKLNRADTLWKQVNGFPPYVDEKTGAPRPLQKGFSIEGYIPDNGILSVSETGQRVINRVLIDGSLVTPRPAYTDSVITAVYKALDELQPDRRNYVSDNIRGKFLRKIETEKQKDSYYQQRFKLEEALNDAIDEIMVNGVQSIDRLNILFDEYKAVVIPLIMQHGAIFYNPAQPAQPQAGSVVHMSKAGRERLRVLKSIEGQLAVYLETRQKDQVKKSLNKEARNDTGSNSAKRFRSTGKADYRKHN